VDGYFDRIAVNIDGDAMVTVRYDEVTGAPLEIGVTIPNVLDGGYHTFLELRTPPQRF
jgi:hypothetical protein